MINIILDSSNRYLSVGLSEKEVIDSISYEAWQQQSEFIIPELDKLLKKNNFTRDDIGCVIVSKGPGSYTGIRLSISIAKVICLVCKAKMITLSSLEVLQNLNKTSICIMDARSGRSYFAVYDKHRIILEDQIMNNADVINYINDHKEFAVCGDTKYLNINGYNADVIFNMNELAKLSEPLSDPLGAKAIYLKDEYATI